MPATGHVATGPDRATGPKLDWVHTLESSRTCRRSEVRSGQVRRTTATVSALLIAIRPTKVHPKTQARRSDVRTGLPGDRDDDSVVDEPAGLSGTRKPECHPIDGAVDLVGEIASRPVSVREVAVLVGQYGLHLAFGRSG